MSMQLNTDNNFHMMSILFLRFKENYNYTRLHIKTINYIHMISRQLGPYIYMMSRKLH